MTRRDGREFELKFAIDTAECDRLFRHPALVAAASKRAQARLVSTYFDTPDTWLRRNRISLRVRRSEAGMRQTVKRADTLQTDRQEFEHDGGPEPDLAWLKTTPLWSLFEEGDVAGKLEPQFSVEVDRVTVPLAYRGASIEGALDAGAIKAKGLSSPVSEFELELVDGRPRAVFALGRRLARDLPLMPSLTTKSEHGHAVADLTWGRPVKWLEIDLSGARTIADAFAIVVQACLQLVLKNAALINGDDDVDAVHKARVGLRRLRAAVALFRPVLRARRLRCLQRDLKWASARFGEARDADVFRGHLDASDVNSRDLVAVLDRSQAQAHHRLRRMLASVRWRLLCLDLVEFAMSGVRRGRRRARFRPFVRRRLARQRRGLGHRAKGLRHLSTHAMHDVRKRAKTLRYDIELVADEGKLGGTRAARRLRDALETLQESLGTLHDQHALDAHLRGLVRTPEPPAGATSETWARAAFAAGQVVAKAPEAVGCLAQAAKAARQLRRSKAFA